jgi:antitoxin component YwqK of YwqJK toxin-antitoxin module
VNGKEEGTQKAFKSDGRIKANYTVINGERFGLIGMKRCFTVDNEESQIIYED